MDSIFLQKQVRDNAKDLQEFCKELEEWGNEMKRKDDSLKRSSNNQTETPSSQNKVSKIDPDKKICENMTMAKKTKKIKGTDYAAWDKFDADAYCRKLDKEDTEENSSAESELSDEVDEASIDLANCEKEKGNSFVKKQQWDAAIKCYTRAIECYAYDPIYYANRALCYLKKEMYRNAESDSTTALQLDNTYVKAYQRRAAARENLNQLCEARDDILRVLELEKKNEESRNVLKRLEKKMQSSKQQQNTESTKQQRPISKFTLSRQKHRSTDAKVEMEHGDSQCNSSPMGERIIEHVAQSTSSSKMKSETMISPENEIIISTKKPTVEQSNVHNINVSYTLNVLENELLKRHNSENIQLYKGIDKPPKIRSRKPLKRIKIIDVDVETEEKYLYNKVENKEKHNTHRYMIENKELQQVDMAKTKISETPNENNCNDRSMGDVESFMQLNIPVPKTAVQFYSGWNTIVKNNHWKKLYLQQINPSDLPLIFKESLESKVFSQIIDTLNDNCSNSDLSPYNFLIGLSEVKRFSALTMFMSSKDKQNLLNIIDNLKQDNKNELLDVDNLIKLYEL